MSFKLIFGCVPFIVWALTCLAFVRPSRLGKAAKGVWCGVLLVCFGKFLWFKLLGGDAFVPDLPEKLIWFMNWFYSGAFVLFALAAVSLRLQFKFKMLLLPALSWLLAGWGVWNGIRLPEIEELELEYADLPKGLEGYRIVHISDLHVTTAARRWRTEGVVDMVNRLKPDLICITGDMMDGDPVRFKGFIEPIRRLSARDGVYASTGNHEFYHRFDLWLPVYESWGIRFLRDEADFPHPELALAGVDDEAANRFRSDGAGSPDVARAFAGAGASRFRLLMEHRPGNAVDNARKHRVDLQLSGHTHGGVMPLMSWLVAGWNNGFTKGVYDLPGGGRLYVSPGSGQWAGFPMRLFNPSVVTVITLVSGQSQNSCKSGR